MARVSLEYVPMIGENEKEVAKAVNLSLRKINDIFKSLAVGINNVDFGDGTTEENMRSDYVAVEFSTAGTELTGTHTLNRTPTAIVGVKLDKPGAIYFSKAATSSSIYLKSDTDSLSGVIILV